MPKSQNIKCISATSADLSPYTLKSQENVRKVNLQKYKSDFRDSPERELQALRVILTNYKWRCICHKTNLFEI